MTDDPRSQRERMLAGDLYIADDSELARESRRAAELYGAYNASLPSDADLRRRMLADLLGSLGDGSEIRPPFYCDYGYQTHIGAGVIVCPGVTIGEDTVGGAGAV
jgi:maltose O-acetyltransferase